jgi:Multiubiquitin
VSIAVETHQGPTYEVNLDGDVRSWPKPTITVSEIRGLAGWAADQPVVMVDLKTNDERDLREDEVIDLKPGHGFSKKVKFKRGSW